MSQHLVRTRFAPSPTGFLHVGGARTALFSWAYAKKMGGEFILRIEDTDCERSTQASIQAILEGLAWLGLDYDQGPFYQMKRLDRYQAVVDQLLAEDKAYRCYCSKERLEKLRQDQIAAKTKARYDGHCRDHQKGDPSQPHVIRFKTPKEGVVQFTDLVHGSIEIANAELDDLVLVRTDGVPTYNFAVVVDDIDMAITHVIRGDDHINNTPRQINLYYALGEKVPVYAHVPMILGDDGKRLSKRHGAVSVLQYKEEGFLPEALVNYLVRLGWSHGDQEIFSKNEIIDFFDIAHINKSAAAFNTEKLLWLNQHYIKTEKPELIAISLKPMMLEAGLDLSAGPALALVVDVQRERAKTLVELVEKSRYFYEDVTEYAEKAAEKNLKTEALLPLKRVREKLANLTEWQPEPIHQVIIDSSEALNLKLGKIAQPIRVAITGDVMSPPIDVTLQLIGKERVLERLDKAIRYIDCKAQE